MTMFNITKPLVNPAILTNQEYITRYFSYEEHLYYGGSSGAQHSRHCECRPFPARLQAHPRQYADSPNISEVDMGLINKVVTMWRANENYGGIPLYEFLSMSLDK